MPRLNDRDFQAEMDMNTLMQAENMNGARKAAAKNMAKQKAKELMAFAGEEGDDARMARDGFKSLG